MNMYEAYRSMGTLIIIIVIIVYVIIIIRDKMAESGSYSPNESLSNMQRALKKTITAHMKQIDPPEIRVIVEKSSLKNHETITISSERADLPFAVFLNVQYSSMRFSLTLSTNFILKNSEFDGSIFGIIRKGNPLPTIEGSKQIDLPYPYNNILSGYTNSNEIPIFGNLLNLVKKELQEVEITGRGNELTITMTLTKCYVRKFSDYWLSFAKLTELFSYDLVGIPTSTKPAEEISEPITKTLQQTVTDSEEISEVEPEPSLWSKIPLKLIIAWVIPPLAAEWFSKSFNLTYGNALFFTALFLIFYGVLIGYQSFGTGAILSYIRPSQHRSIIGYDKKTLDRRNLYMNDLTIFVPSGVVWLIISIFMMLWG